MIAWLTIGVRSDHKEFIEYYCLEAVAMAKTRRGFPI